jgi:hypothetical protein
MALLCWARFLVEWVPLPRWRSTLGLAEETGRPPDEAWRLAGEVERAAARLPFATRCLPRAMALSWGLRKAAIGHALVIAARPATLRDDADALHAWVEIDGTRLIGDLPGPWIEIMRLGR